MFALAILAVLSPINLDHQSARVADEIEIIPLERRLPPDVEAAFPQAFQATPKDDLRLAHGVAKGAGAMDFRTHAGLLFFFCSGCKALLQPLRLIAASPP